MFEELLTKMCLIDTTYFEKIYCEASLHYVSTLYTEIMLQNSLENYNCTIWSLANANMNDQF